jgi:2-hydroxy-3-keto-5-methylthiopentenyl-1-phosphate phosphatase
MIESLVSNFSNHSLLNFFRNQNSSFIEYEENFSDLVSHFEKFDHLIKVGEIEYDNTDMLMVFTL